MIIGRISGERFAMPMCSAETSTSPLNTARATPQQKKSLLNMIFNNQHRELDSVLSKHRISNSALPKAGHETSKVQEEHCKKMNPVPTLSRVSTVNNVDHSLRLRPDAR